MVVTFFEWTHFNSAFLAVAHYCSSDVCMYRIASNYGPGVYFFPAIFNQATKRDRRLLSEETRAVYNL